MTQWIALLQHPFRVRGSKSSAALCVCLHASACVTWFLLGPPVSSLDSQTCSWVGSLNCWPCVSCKCPWLSFKSSWQKPVNQIFSQKCWRCVWCRIGCQCLPFLLVRKHGKASGHLVGKWNDPGAREARREKNSKFNKNSKGISASKAQHLIQRWNTPQYSAKLPFSRQDFRIPHRAGKPSFSTSCTLNLTTHIFIGHARSLNEFNSH